MAAVFKHDEVSLFQVGDFNFLFLAANQNDGGVRRKPEKFFNRTHSFVFRLLFEEFPHGDER